MTLDLAETIDRASRLGMLDVSALDALSVSDRSGALPKDQVDIARFQGSEAKRILEAIELERVA